MTAVGSEELEQQDIRRARQDFARLFGSLYDAGGRPPLRVLAAAARQRMHTVRGGASPVPASPQRISDWKSGRNVPYRFESLVPVLVVLIEGARRRGNTTGIELTLRGWRRVWAQAARASRSEPSNDTGGVTVPARRLSGPDTPWFVGRSRSLSTLLDLLEDSAAAPAGDRVILLTGASGVGKTALLTAGVLPALAAGLPQQWDVRTVVPRSHTPLVTLEMLDEVCAESGRYHDGSRTRGGEISHRNLIVLDQFDNIADDPALVAGGGPFFTWLRHAVEHAVVLISLRSVPAGLASSLADVGIRPREHSLQSLTSDQLRGAIREVSSSGAGRIDDALEEVLMARISGIRGDGSRYGREPAELLILVRTLRAMALHRAGGGFRFGSYRRIGGVEGVVHAMAESTWTQLSVEERLVARQILLELITVRGDSGETRRRVPCTEARRALGADSASVRVFDRLVDGRLLTIDQGQVYLSHDLLLTWNQLAGWVDEQAARLQQQH